MTGAFGASDIRHDGDAKGSGRHEGKARMVKTVGEAAAELGIEAHVLRHWEQVGALTVRRDGNGYRLYDDNALEQARTVLKLRRVGLSLPEASISRRLSGMRDVRTRNLRPARQVSSVESVLAFGAVGPLWRECRLGIDTGTGHTLVPAR
jgi:hypothetical protein